MDLLLGTADGVWHLDGTVERIGLAGTRVSHVADRGDVLLAAVPRDGVYRITPEGEQRLWNGDARAVAIGRDGALYVGTEPAKVFRSVDDQVARIGALLDGKPDLTIGTVTTGPHAWAFSPWWDCFRADTSSRKYLR